MIKLRGLAVLIAGASLAVGGCQCDTVTTPTVPQYDDYNVFHGQTTVASGTYWSAYAAFSSGDILYGDVEEVDTTAVTAFFYADSVEFAEWVATGDTVGLLKYTPNADTYSLNETISTAGTYYVVIDNATGGARTCRIRLMRRVPL